MIKKFYLKLLMSLLLVALAVPQAQADEVTLFSGTSTNSYAPVHSSYLDGVGSTYQVIYPASELADLDGSNITGVKFYASGNLNFSGGSIQVSVGETSNTTFSSATAITGLDVVATTAVSSSNDEFVLNFDNEYPYNGGNLVIEIKVLTAVTLNGYSTMNWYGTSASGNNVYYYDSGYYSSSGTQSWLPKTTFTFEVAATEPYSAKVTPSELDFGGIAVGASKVMNVTLKNTGTNAFTPSVNVTGAGFSTTYTATEIASKGTATIPVTFNPTTAGDFTGTLTINCGEAGTFTVDITGSASLNLTLCDGSDTNDYLPIYGYYYDAKQINQMIYPASMLSDIVGKKINSLTFYTTNEYFSGGKYNVSIGITDQSTFETPVRLTGLTLVASNLVAVSGAKEITIYFDEPFEYNGNNLVVDFEVTETGSYGSSRTYFQGVNQSTNTSFHSYGSSVTGNGVYNTSANVRQFLPKVKIGYEDGAGSVTVDPSSLTFGGEEFYAGSTEDKTFTVTNTTEEAVTITMTGDNVFTFNPATVAAGATETITVTYAPTAAGTHSATLTVGGKTVSLTGTAAEAPVTTPTITTSVNAVTITTAPTTTGTATFTVTGTNLTGDITVAASDSWFTVSPTTIAAADAANGVTVTVSYQAPGTEETKTGTITLTSNGATEKIVNLTAKSEEVIAEGAVTPTAINFGEVLVGQTSAAQLVKVSNTGSDAFTPSFSIDNPAFSIDEPTPIVGGTSISYNVTYTPTAAGVQNGVLTVSFGGLNHTVALTGIGKELAGYDITSSAASGVHNFGDVFKDGLATWNVTLTNNGANAVTPVIEGLAAPFSAENVPATLAAGESATITFKFAPTAIQAYGPTSIVVKFAETTAFQFDYTFRGNGIENTGTLPPSTFDNETYTWTDDNGDEHTSPYSEIATDPNQMIALLKAVYTNKNLPGNYYRGYDANGNPEKTVGYPAIGQVTVDKYYNVDFVDAYGWGMTHDETSYPTIQTVQTSSSNERTFYTMNPNEYKPNQEGVTLLLVEMKDGVGASTTTTDPTSYASLKNIFSKMFKSVRVIPNSKRVTKNGVEGTLFKIDCDKMNRFFFLAKGRLRLYDNHEYLTNGLNASSYALANKKISDGSVSVSSSDKENTVADVNPFNAMYEQFSPVNLNNAQESSDVYQLLINMESYDVEHDCEAIPWASTTGASGTVTGHEFNMYGKASISDDCQDVRDLMFFVPDKRMTYYNGRDKAPNAVLTDEYTNYYKQYAPNMGMYVIRQNAITGVQNGTAEEYTLHLSWQSNLTDFVPGENGEYTIYLVNPDGTYTVVAQHISSDQTTYDLTVDMAQHGQQVTYVIQGQDNTGFLSLQFSNEESFIIPGLDPNEKFQMMTGAEYYSRFDPQSVQNFYANGMQVMAYPDAATSDYAGQTFNFYRKAAGDADWTLVGTAQVNTAGTEATVSMVETTQRQQSEYKFGYKQNPATVAVTTDANGNKVFGVIFDNFKADVSTNEHPSSYSYKMEVANTSLHSNEISIKVYKTQMRNLTGTFNEEYVENDEVRQDVDNSRQFDIDVEHSSKTEILRYGAYRWDSSYGAESNPYAILNLNSDTEEDISPSGQASNQGEFYSVYMNGDSYIGDDVYVAQGETGQATFVDDVPATTNKADEYTYAPVIETFTGRADYNTYGAPMQTTATGKIAVTPVYGGKSGYTWEANGNTYRYYNVFVNVNTLDLPEGYEVAKVRAWRKIDASYLNEKLEDYAYRAQLDANGEFMFDDPQTANTQTQLGNEELPVSTNQNRIYKGTFGALDVENGATVPMKFFVRIYFKKNDGSKAANDEYYITEVEVDGELNNSIPTSIFGVESYKVVTGIKYYNLAGIESDVPFQGVNIEVTTYEDGSRTSRKIMK